MYRLNHDIRTPTDGDVPMKVATITTNRGVIRLELFGDKVMPNFS